MNPGSTAPTIAGLPEAIHCVGVAGGGLSALATLLAARGHRVSGSDRAAPPDLGCGVTVMRGHAAGNLGDARLVVRSAAVGDDNPEVAAARRADLPVLKYSEALGRLMGERRGVAVAGTHGKTTTTGLLAHLLRAAGGDPGWVVGGRPLDLPAAAHWGAGEYLVVEACEYDHSFLNLDYEVALVGNVVADHLDCFGDEAGVRAAFEAFLERLPAEGLAVLGDGVLERLSPRWPRGVRRVVASRRVSLEVVSEGPEGVSGRARSGDEAAAFRFAPPGRHNLENANLAMATALELGVSLGEAAEALGTVRGPARRLQGLGQLTLPGGEVELLDDFAHHPDALWAAAEALRARFPGRRLVGVFQPHQVCRTQDFLDDFAAALGAFDRIGLCDIFVTRDAHPASAPQVLAALAERVVPPPTLLGPASRARAALEPLLEPGDVCVIMGAGDVDQLARELAREARRP